MVTNYYNASNNFSAPIRKEPKPFSPEYHSKSPDEECVSAPLVCEEESASLSCQGEHKHTHKKQNAFLETDPDTLVLLALLWILFVSKSNDRLLEIALIYLLLS